MKNINLDEDPLKQHWNPRLVSEPSDFIQLIGEKRLRLLAKTIPSHGHHQLPSTTQGCISATIHATQEFLTQVVSGMTLLHPDMGRNLEVSTSGLDAINWLKRSEANQSGWLPPYPVTGHITWGILQNPPRYGFSAFEPAVTLSVNRNDDDCDDFVVRFSVADSEDMRLLSMLIHESGDLWDEFEHTFGVTPFTSIPLPEDIESNFGEKVGCREYITCFIEHIVAKADENKCLETFDLEFSVKQEDPLHEPIVAAIALLNSFSEFRYSVQTMDDSKARSQALNQLQSAIITGLIAQSTREAENN